MGDNHPNNYPINQDKTYEISVSAGKKIKITFEEFSLKHNWRCGWDYLMIVDGNGNTILDKSCGATKPAAVTSQTNKVKVIFHSDYSLTSKIIRTTFQPIDHYQRQPIITWHDI